MIASLGALKGVERKQRLKTLKRKQKKIEAAQVYRDVAEGATPPVQKFLETTADLRDIGGKSEQ